MKGRVARRLRHRTRSAIFLLPAWFSPSSTLRAAFHRARGVRIGAGAEIGYFVILDNLYPDRVIVEEEATISARSTILAHDESKSYTGRGDEVLLQTRICRQAFIGVHCVIMPGVTIGSNAIVGAGSVVTADVASGTTVAGVPARSIAK